MHEVCDWLTTGPAYIGDYMKNIAYKNAIIVMGGTNAAIITDKAYANKQRKVVSEETGFISALSALNETLDSIPNNDKISKEVFRIFVPDMLKGFSMGSYIEYIRTNQTSSGRAFTDKEKQLVTDIAHKMMNKGLNFKINETKFAPKELANMKNYAMSIAKELKDMAPKTAPVAQQQTAAPAVNPVVAKLQELMTKALDEGDFETYDKLEERLNKISGATPQVPQSQPQESQQEETYDDLEDEEYDENEVELPEDLLNAEY